MSIIINEFLNGENSICREERQFSLYLYNLLTNCKRIKLDSEKLASKSYEVANAYYEASFMRDYFNDADSKGMFNIKLLSFANRRLKEMYDNPEAAGVYLENVDVSSVQPDAVYDINTVVDSEEPPFDIAKHINGWSGLEKKYRNPIAKWMMNVKPDIALLLKRRGVKRDEYRMHFIECKYMSGLDSYPALIGVKDDNGNVIECRRMLCSQLDVQKLVIDFLCEEMELSVLSETHDADKDETVCKNVPVEGGFVSLAQFIGVKNAAADADMSDKGKKTVSIQKLYDYGINIMSEDKKIKEPKVVLGGYVEIGF